MPLLELMLLAQDAATDPPGLAVQFAPWGVLTAVVGLFTGMWRSTVAAHKARADDWRAAAQLDRRARDEAVGQLMDILAGVQKTAESATS